MTKHAATTQARKLATTRREWRYVIWSVEEMDPAGQHYHVASEETADTFYAGAEVVLTVGPDGTVEA